MKLWSYFRATDSGAELNMFAIVYRNVIINNRQWTLQR